VGDFESDGDSDGNRGDRGSSDGWGAIDSSGDGMGNIERGGDHDVVLVLGGVRNGHSSNCGTSTVPISQLSRVKIASPYSGAVSSSKEQFRNVRASIVHAS
jgi:hypothetical protein